ncbi:MAG: hypothetical protein AAB649_04500 [Patescibacteria group bacterium]
MKKKNIELSPASFITMYAPHAKKKRSHANSILTELVTGGEPVGVYSAQMQVLHERFNGMYYKFLNRLTIIPHDLPLSKTQRENIHSLFQELLEMRTLLAKEPISTR